MLIYNKHLTILNKSLTAYEYPPVHLFEAIKANYKIHYD